MTWAEQHLRQVITGQARWGAINPLIASSFYRDYPFSMMAADEAAASGREAPPVVAAVWRCTIRGGGWWPFANSVVISDRPAQIHLNKEYLLHREVAPAAVFAMGQVWAWNGHAMREEWILHPESILARDLKHFDAAFRACAAARPSNENLGRFRIGRWHEIEEPCSISNWRGPKDILIWPVFR